MPCSYCRVAGHNKTSCKLRKQAVASASAAVAKPADVQVVSAAAAASASPATTGENYEDDLAQAFAACGVEDVQTRYIYALRMSENISAIVDGNGKYYMVKVGITNSPGIGQVLVRFHQHRSSMADELMLKLKAPCSSKASVTTVTAPGNAHFSSSAQVDINSISDIAHVMKDEDSGEILTEYEDVMFVLPISNTITEKHEIEQIESAVRHQLGATVNDRVQFKQERVNYRIANNRLTPLTYELNDTELIMVHERVFNFVQACFVAEQLDTVYGLEHLLEPCSNLPFADSAVLNLTVHATAANMQDGTLRVSVRKPLDRTLRPLK